MQANVGRETAPELILRKRLHSLGIRFRKACRPETDFRCTADIVFRPKSVCVFVDGCFWHGCPTHFTAPKKNRAWWTEKIEANIERDQNQSRILVDAGWTVIRIWEHEIYDDLTTVTNRVVSALSG